MGARRHVSLRILWQTILANLLSQFGAQNKFTNGCRSKNTFVCKEHRYKFRRRVIYCGVGRPTLTIVIFILKVDNILLSKRKIFLVQWENVYEFVTI